MTVFWGLAAVMVAVALLFTVPWVLRSSRSTGADPDALYTEVIRTQLAELTADLEAGRLAEPQYVAARQDLERALLDDLSHPDAGSAGGKPRSGHWVAVLLVVLIPGMAVGLYQAIGTQQIIPLLERGVAQPAGQSDPDGDQHSLEEMIAQLDERLRANPDDLRGWMLLGRSYASVRRFPDAANAYANAYRINADHPEVLAAYADALVMANGGQFTDQAGGLLEHALQIQPDNIKALWLLGHWKNQQGAYQEAIAYWQRAAALLPAGGEDAAVIAQQIQVARAQLGTADTAAAPGGAAGTSALVAATQPAAAVGATSAVTSAATAAATQSAPDATASAADTAAATSPAAADSAAAGAGIAITVRLAAGLAARADPGDTVFIFARALSGPRMPLAIVRKQVSDLPVSVTLDDSQAMMPTMALSKFAEVTVGARVSKSGNAMPQSGDLQGSVAPVKVGGSAQVEITIDSVVP